MTFERQKISAAFYYGSCVFTLGVAAIAPAFLATPRVTHHALQFYLHDSVWPMEVRKD